MSIRFPLLTVLSALFVSGLTALGAAPTTPNSTPPAPSPALQAHLGQAAADEKKRDYAGAIAEYDAVIALAPQMEAAWRLRGQAHTQLFQERQAIADETQAISLNPKDAQAYRIRAEEYRRPESIDRAVADVEQAIALDPASAPSHYQLGQIYDLRLFWERSPAPGGIKADRDRAIAEYTQAISLLPDAMPFASFSRAGDYEADGNSDLALADYARTLRVFPKFSVVYLRRAEVYERKFDFDHAVAEYTQLIQSDPHFELLPDVYVRRGIALLRKGDYAELSRGPDDERAIADFTQAISSDPVKFDSERADAFANRAVAYDRKKEPEKAAQDRAEASRLEGIARAELAANGGVIVRP